MFMRAYQDMVFSTAARMTGNDAQAEDIAQDVFIKAFENFADLRANNSAGGWLKTVTTNLTLNHLTRHRRRWRSFSEFTLDESAPEPPLFDPPAPDTLAADLGAEQRRDIVDGALRRLPDHQRLPLVLFHFEDFSYEEIASRLGISLAKVKTDIRRARAALVPMLSSRGLVRDNLED